MTVCIAAICSWVPGDDTIIAMSDRMITSSDVQFEPDQSKMFRLSKHVGILIAGAAAPQIAICNAVARRVGSPENAEVTVEEAANLFAEEHAAYRRKHAEQIYLRPLGMDLASFLEKQATLNGTFVADTTLAIQNYDIGDTETIIMGKDISGAHLFHIDKWGNIRCDDLVAFSTAGIGAWHASSHLMLAKYSKNLDFQRALLQIYIAKRKAEVAPGIGRTTDIFFGASDALTTLASDVRDILEATVNEMESNMLPIAARAEADFAQRVDDFLARHQEIPSHPDVDSLPITKDETSESGEWGADTWSGPTGSLTSTTDTKGASNAKGTAGPKSSD